MSAPLHPTQLEVAAGLQHVDGMAIIGKISCESLGLKDVFVMFDPPTFSIALLAPCGCIARQPLVFAAHLLASSMKAQAGDAAPGSNAHMH